MKRPAPGKALVWKENGFWWAVAPGFPPIAHRTQQLADMTGRIMVAHNARRRSRLKRWISAFDAWLGRCLA